jgi:peptidyl-dipeptidase Dcp
MSNNLENNPFVKAFELKSWSTLDESIPFEKIKVEHYLPALEYSIELARTNISQLKENPAAPNFENTMEALENCSELQEIVAGVYFNLFSSEASPEHQALAQEISPKIAAFSSEISLDAKLFERIKGVFDKMNSLNLSGEQKMLVEKTYRSFVRNGALLSPEKKEQLRQIDQELSILSPKFSENVLKATNAFQMLVEQKSELDGLPDGAVEAAAEDAKRKGFEGKWLFSLQAPSYLPFMQYSKNRELRKKLWYAMSSRATAGEYSNQDVILKTVQLKNSRAQLLGYNNHAEITLTERMAENPKRVNEFLDKIIAVSLPAAKKDLEEVQSFAQRTDKIDQLMPWDFAFYSEKLKEEKYSFNEEELRPFFKLENVVQGVFEHATRLYGLKFTKISGVSKYHPDVETYEVKDAQNNFVSLFYTDFFPRETKKDGAWMTTFRDQGYFMGKNRRPHVSIVCNFTKPTPTKPSLISYDEVTTLFHEFGHALHGMLSQCNYRSLSGTNVYWDFVELPSQIMENWAREKDGLDLFAKHYETNQSIPAELVQKIKAAHRFQAGYYSLRQSNFGSLDLAWHTTDPSQISDVVKFELLATEKTRLFPYFEGTNMSCSFSHIFAGGYSAGYYSYKWAEVLDADAFEFFQEKGIFSPEVATLFKNEILSKGGTEHPMSLYKKFRGREPDPNALLRREGLI